MLLHQKPAAEIVGMPETLLKIEPGLAGVKHQKVDAALKSQLLQLFQHAGAYALELKLLIDAEIDYAKNSENFLRDPNHPVLDGQMPNQLLALPGQIAKVGKLFEVGTSAGVLRKALVKQRSYFLLGGFADEWFFQACDVHLVVFVGCSKGF